MSIDLRSLLSAERLRRSRADSGAINSTDGAVLAKCKAPTAWKGAETRSRGCELTPVAGDIMQVRVMRHATPISPFRAPPQNPCPALFCSRRPATPSSSPVRLSVAWQGVYYIADFISSDEEAELVRQVDAAPAGRWIACGDGRRRMQNWGGKPGRREVTEVRQLTLSK